MRGKPKPRAGSGLADWRSRQKTGAIMKPATFQKIKEKAKARYGIGEERAEKVAGAAYWKAARAKHRKSKKSDSTANIIGSLMI